MAKTSKKKYQSVRERRLKKQRRQRLLLLLGILVVTLSLLGVVFLPSYLKADQPQVDIVVPEQIQRPMADFNAMGDPNAPVTIIEYSDFQCPFCKRFSDQTEPLITENYVATGDVYFVFRTMGNFISDNIHKGKTESRDAAEAAYCAGDQGKFWEFKDILYANWLGEDAGSFTPARINAMAEALDLDMEAFNDCVESGKYRERVQTDETDGIQACVTGTPSFLINGKLFVGAQPFEAFAKEIEQAKLEAEQ